MRCLYCIVGMEIKSRNMELVLEPAAIEAEVK